MKNMRQMAFHGNGKPRGWLRAILFRTGTTPRPLLRRIVFKKNGEIRPSFAGWVPLPNSAQLTAQGQAGIDSEETMSIESLRQAEKLHALINLQLFEETARQWQHEKAPDKPIEADALSRLLRPSADQRLILSISHDDYVTIPGGVQLSIQREERAIVLRGDRYLHVRPWQPLPRLAHLEEQPDPVVALRLDGLAVGTCAISVLTSAVSEISANGYTIISAIHHLMGHSPETISELLLAARAARRLFWLHDYFSICPSYNLQRNTLQFCHAPQAKSNACSLCVFGEERQKHLARMEQFFLLNDIEIVSPSQVALDLWRRSYCLPHKTAHIVEHMSLEWQPRPNALAIGNPRQIRIGFLGTPAPHKGWPIFEHLAQHPDLKQTCTFVALTKQKVGRHISSSRVHVTASQSMAMVEAVSSANIDLVLMWASWPETFSLTTYEAIAGGAYVITNPVSGNVATAVTSFGCGTILESEADLISFFTDGGAMQLANEARARRQSQIARVQFHDAGALLCAEEA